MNLRVLKQEENGKTRPLWEKVFTEDTRAFLDYYYYIKTRDNQIYVIEEDEQIVSMLQLNPYQIRIEDGVFPSAYIIAVATDENYRSRGYMRALLIRSLGDMYGKKIPFTFLMPAAAAIYTPYDFRYIYDQTVGEIRGEQKAAAFRSGGILEEEAGLWNAGEMADFFNENFSGKWQVCTERDAGYYQTMILEQSSEQGGVRLLRANGRIVGMAAYGREEKTEIREPLCLEGYEEDMQKMMAHLAVDGQDMLTVYADAQGKKKPVIMARIVCLPVFLSALKVPVGTGLNCSFAVIDPIIRENSRVWNLQSRTEEEEIHVRETEDSEGVIPIAELTELLFGRADISEIKKRENVILSERMEVELGKITKLENVFINEVV